MMGKDGIARVYVVLITVLFLEREVPRQKKTDGAFRTQFRSNIVCQNLLKGAY